MKHFKGFIDEVFYITNVKKSIMYKINTLCF